MEKNKTKLYLVGIALISILCLYLFRSFFAADKEYCPKTITIKDHIENSPKDWEVFHSDLTPELKEVSLFDGPVRENANLKPEDDSQDHLWKLANNNDRGYWIACYYTGTRIFLAKKLETNLTSCRVSFDKNVKVDGYNAIKKVACF